MKIVTILEYDAMPFCLYSSESILTAKQIKQDMIYLTMSKIWSKMSVCKRAQVGALLVKNNTIISDGFNGTPSGMNNCCEDENDNTYWYVMHAESNLITKLGKSSISGEGGTMYVTLSPCRDCSKLILQSGISRIVFMESYRILDGITFLKDNIDITHYFKMDPIIDFDPLKLKTLSHHLISDLENLIQNNTNN